MPSLEREANRETQIQVQLSGIKQQIEEIERWSLLFLEKLAPILVPCQPRCEEGKSTPTPDVPLANQLRILRERLEAIVTGIKDVISRCEL